MQKNTPHHSHEEQQTATYCKPTIKAYDVTTIRQALGPAIGFSTGRIDDEESLLFDD